MTRGTLMTLRIIVILSALVVLRAHPADACIRAGEANTVVGWSEDGKYALYELVENGRIEHAEILPTSYDGFVYTIMPNDDGSAIVVSRVPVGKCAEWGDGDDKTVVENKQGKLTDKSLMALATVAKLKFSKAENPTKADKPTAAFTGKKRYDVHDVELTSGTKKVQMPVPVYCLGSCLADENWKKWSIIVDGVHTLANGSVLYELAMANVCNGGTIHRVITETPASKKVPKSRCKGSGE
jgi:hypothetical protein